MDDSAGYPASLKSYPPQNFDDMQEALTPPSSAETISRLRPFISEERMARMEQVLRWRTRRLCVVLEDIFQPHNAAACLRSCDCFGVQDVHVIEKRNFFEPSGNVALGAEKWLTLRRWSLSEQEAPATDTCLRHLRQSGYRLVATTLDEPSVPPDKLPLDAPVALLFGTEETGLSEEALQMADLHLHLPMFGFTQSFNISVSCALTLQALVRRLHQEPSMLWQLSVSEAEDLLARWMLDSIRGGAQILQRLSNGTALS